MPRPVLISGIAVGIGLALLWAFGGFSDMADWALVQQRAVQNSMAQGIRAVRAGNAGAMAALLGVCFTYGFVHAVGPGHGKVLIGGYAMARRVPLRALVAIAFASSMAQAAVAVGLVYGLFAAFGWTRDRVLGLSDRVMAPLGHVLVAGVGLWLIWRGIQGLRRTKAAHRAVAGHAHDHHADGHHCSTCGHAHAPTLSDVAALTGWRDCAALIAGIAIRPCSGALFLLILTFQMGIAGAGVLGTFVMGLGTASVTMAIALLAVWSREGALATLPAGRLTRALPLIEVVAGATVTLAALHMLARVV
jgi:nickel/cobalt transporter (NicO) family protein